MNRLIQAGVCLVATALLGAGMASAQVQSSQQQKCINKVNKAAIKVQAAQGKANAGCVKAYVQGSEASAEACILDDPKDKVEGKQANVLNDESHNCDPMDLPDFAYTSGAFAGTTAYQAEVNLVHDIFGNPANPGLFICDTQPDECLCQRQTISRVEKLSRAISKIFVKCKKAALAIGKLPAFPAGAASAADIARCITDGTISLSVQADTKTKIATAQTQLQDTAGQFCYKQVTDEFAAGVCSGHHGDAPGLTLCLAKRVKCRFCLMENAIDNMAADCSTFSGTTCP